MLVYDIDSADELIKMTPKFIDRARLSIEEVSVFWLEGSVISMKTTDK